MTSQQNISLLETGAFLVGNIDRNIVTSTVIQVGIAVNSRESRCKSRGATLDGLSKQYSDLELSRQKRLLNWKNVECVTEFGKLLP